MSQKFSGTGENMAKINLQTRGCEVDDAMQAHFAEKVENLEHHWPSEVDIEVRVSQHRGRFAAEITLHSEGLILRGEERASTLRQAFDSAVDKLDAQLCRFKEKSQARKRRHDNRDDVAGTIGKQTMTQAGLAPDGVSTNASSHISSNGNGINGVSSTQNGAPEAADDDGVVRVKRFSLKPMSAEEASLQMELLGHSFFVFRHHENHQVSVVYRRRDGGFGIIEPVAD